MSQKEGRRSRCKVCTSLHVDEIEKRLARGESCRNISRWLKAEHGVGISYRSITRHVKHHLHPADLLPSKILYDKLMELEEEIDAAKEQARIIVECRRTLATLMAKEAILSKRAQEPIILPEKRRVIDTYTRAVEVYARIVGKVTAAVDPATFYSRRRRELEEAGVVDLRGVDFSKLPRRTESEE